MICRLNITMSLDQGCNRRDRSKVWPPHSFRMWLGCSLSLRLSACHLVPRSFVELPADDSMCCCLEAAEYAQQYCAAHCSRAPYCDVAHLLS